MAMIATLAFLIIEAFLAGGSGKDAKRFENPRPGLERLSDEGRSSSPASTEPAVYPVDSAARGTVVFLLPQGPRTLRSLEIQPTDATRLAWKAARLRLVWDADAPEAAGLDLPVDLAFGGLAEGEAAWVNRLPMPYRDGAMLVIDTESPISGRIRIESSPGVERDAGFLRGALIGETSTIEESGRGRLVAIVAGKPFSGPIVIDGKEPGPVESLMVDGGKSAGRGTVSWFADPAHFQKSFRLERKRGEGSSSALFWYTERPSSGRSARGKQP